MQIFDIPIDKTQKEATRHGSFTFPVGIYETQLDLNVLGYVNWHWHDEMQYAYVTVGTVSFYVNRTKVTLKKGQGIFINSGVLHMAKAAGRPDSTYVCIDVHPTLLRGYPGNAVDQKYIRPYLKNEQFTYCVFQDTQPDERKLLEHLQEIFEEYSSQERGYEYKIYVHLLIIWWELIHLSVPEVDTSPVSSTDNERLKTLLSYIQEHYKEKLTLQECANSIGLCTSECCRFFKHSMNCTIFTYLTNYRIEQSISTLLSTTKSISEVAYDNGFSSTSYFIDKFHKKTGRTPLEFRKNHNKGYYL